MRPVDLKSRICRLVAGGLTKAAWHGILRRLSNTLPSTDPPGVLCSS
jgi:hypothetical protein